MKLVHFILAFSFCATLSLCAQSENTTESTEIQQIACVKCSSILACKDCDLVSDCKCEDETHLACKDCDLVSDSGCENETECTLADCGCKGKKKSSQLSIEEELEQAAFIGCGCEDQDTEDATLFI